ncbi:Oidioi.mRNA.OKI2018_I69.chr2.g4206.t2.cds [Oikopleura dioica]|uniref:Oidioi.mRNA.OKI2018_I69.chr2.g4206.t2.cds n=1 Tax=Oikopleura dioica TaxID=34765 RepID=A0ABN7T0V0_OIKDI|nr:Oidioi.mRNA.OKI2018_I69.chr2.g4206.t2.cds [Oikopleura dioica]
MWGMRGARIVDSDIFPNHWLLGGIFDAPDPNQIGLFRTWEMRNMRLMQDRYGEKGPIYIFLGLTPFVFVHEAPCLEALLRSQVNREKNFGYDFLKPWLGDGVLISAGKKWQHRRRNLNSAFHFNILSSYFLMMREIVDEYKESLTKRVKEGIKEFEFHDEFNKLSLQIINYTAMGFKLNYNDPLAERYRKDVDKIKRSLRRALPFLDNLLYSHFEQNEIDWEGVKEEMEVFMFAGHDTTTATSVFALQFITENKEVLAKVLKEQDSIYGDSDRAIEMEDLKSMTYLEQCIKETLRLRAPVREYFRKVNESPLKSSEGDIHISETASISINADFIHHSEKHFPNAFTFNPSRWSSEERRHPYAFIPFSAGPRNCIGQKFAMIELKLVLATLLRNFKFQPKIKSEDTIIASDFISSPWPGCWISVTE